MKLCTSYLLLALSALTATESAAQQSAREQPMIAGYQPVSLVNDILNIDLDQAAMEEQLEAGTGASLIQARKFYTEGAHSKSVATLTLSWPHPTGIPAGSPIKGEDDYNHEVTGVVYLDVPPGANKILFQYSTYDDATDNKLCHVGARRIDEQITNGCLRRDGTVQIPSGAALAYDYDPFVDNNNGRTLQSFSMMARNTLYECQNCPYPDFLKFREYYGSSNYADQWITAAFDGEKTNFVNGNADFDLLSLVGRGEAIKKGASYMSVWMEVIGKMESALAGCQSRCADNNACNAPAVQEWDEAVALYTGSLEGEDGSGEGFFPYALADKRCTDFHTCGEGRSNDVGISAVNIEIFSRFRKAQLDIQHGICAPAREHKEKIVNLMTVPLVQGTLKYAYVKDKQKSGDKEIAEGAVFAASVLPLVHSCDADSAQTIWENMAVGTGDVDFATVRKAFSSNYDCLGITCADVGGYFDERTRDYFEGADPCKDSSNSLHPGLIAGIAIAGVLLLSCCIPFVYCRLNKGASRGVDTPPLPEFEKEDSDEGSLEETVTSKKSFDLV